MNKKLNGNLMVVIGVIITISSSIFSLYYGLNGLWTFFFIYWILTGFGTYILLKPFINLYGVNLDE